MGRGYACSVSQLGRKCKGVSNVAFLNLKESVKALVRQCSEVIKAVGNIRNRYESIPIKKERNLSCAPTVFFQC